MPKEASIEFQFVSDLHLEFPRASEYVEEFPKVADNLLLLGDVGNPYHDNYLTLIDEKAKQHENVYIVAGNHEYYRNVYDETNAKIESICAEYDNVTFLNKTRVELPGTNCWLLGCTLWSHVIDDYKPVFSFMMNDYRQIYKTQKPETKITVEDTNRWHLEDVAWLEENIAQAKQQGKDVIICTHHAPAIEGAVDPDELAKSDINVPINGTRLEKLFGPAVKAWLFGHTHYNCDFFSHKTRLLSNQRGYENEETAFDAKKIFTYTP